ncbi:hypothetical protein BCR35DRAFT_303185 [Leucosporidium creatinivorum]|uniref:Uncharacterized protein n=1 Tax=Leucosporidium creatinivorum TaxID=106004 RepID=A0A1Y2FJH2_9BASI|nr:hypothetical protein BCR35DRAFT_303185 [Leucosporidium creatinivorum]
MLLVVLASNASSFQVLWSIFFSRVINFASKVTSFPSISLKLFSVLVRNCWMVVLRA